MSEIFFHWKRSASLIFCLLFFSAMVLARGSKADSLMRVLRTAKEDTGKVNTLNALSMELRVVNTDTALVLCTEALKLAEATNFKKGKGYSYYLLGLCHYIKGDTLALGNYNK